jgi:hypothetical protein
MEDNIDNMGLELPKFDFFEDGHLLNPLDIVEA